MNALFKGQTDRSSELLEIRTGVSSFTGAEMTDHITDVISPLFVLSRKDFKNQHSVQFGAQP